MEILIHFSLEVGQDFYTSFHENIDISERHLKFTFQNLIRLDAKSALISKEILCLMKNGFPDGALGRWRALHEVAVTSLFILKHGAECSEKHSQYGVVEAKLS